jgi:hypothetical protein
MTDFEVTPYSLEGGHGRFGGLCFRIFQSIVINTPSKSWYLSLKLHRHVPQNRYLIIMYNYI